MSLSIDQPPFYNPLTKSQGNIPALMIADSWNNWFSTFYQTLITYISQNGIFLPQLTQTQINEISGPQNGQMLYNSSNNTIQVFQNGAWMTVTTS